MLAKRIIPCLDIRDGKTVKGVNFENIRDAGDPVELAGAYARAGADELVFLDITATLEKRKTLSALVRRVAAEINIPFTVGGGVSAVADVEALLEAGADKITINSAAVKHPALIDDLARSFGSQCIVLAIDVKQEQEWMVYIQGGRRGTGKKAFDWALEAADRGAGEILLTSMNRDGTKQGFSLDITRQIALGVTIPVIASGGAGTMADFEDVFTRGAADAALAASIFHFNEITVPALKKYLRSKNISIR